MRRWSARALFADERGMAALVAAIALPVLAGVGAFAVDIAHYRYVGNRLQTAADAAALAGAQLLPKSSRDALSASAVATGAVDMAGRNIPADYGTVTRASDVEIGTFDKSTKVFTVTNTKPNAVRVTAERSPARGNAPAIILGFIFGDTATTIRASAVAARETAQYEDATVKWLNPEAGDFNELYAYCYDYKGTGTAASRRSQMTLIANNDPDGAVVSASGGAVKAVKEGVVLPQCGVGESLSLWMRNIRHVKSFPQLWSNPKATVCISNCGSKSAVNRQIGRAEYSYFTDTSIANGVETYNLGAKILETVSCATDTCAGEIKSGAIPTGGGRTPKTDTSVCKAGKFRYFGWEDRPPGQSGASTYWTDPAWTDTDYDDVRIVMPCPKTALGTQPARLVR